MRTEAAIAHSEPSRAEARFKGELVEQSRRAREAEQHAHSMAEATTHERHQAAEAQLEAAAQQR